MPRLLALPPRFAALFALSFATGCFEDRACTMAKVEADGIRLDMMTLWGETNVYDIHRATPMLDEWKKQAASCGLHPQDVMSIRTLLDQASVDGTVTKEEVEPILVHMDKMVAATLGRSAFGTPRAPLPALPAGAGGCPAPAVASILDMSPLSEHLVKMTASEREAAHEIDGASNTAYDNLRALLQAELRHHETHREFLAFKKSDEAALRTLGVTFRTPPRHTFRAVPGSDGLKIVAEGNLDGDAFVDRWMLDYKSASGDPCTSPLLLAADSVNVTFEGDGPPFIVAAGRPQPLHTSVPR